MIYSKIFMDDYDAVEIDLKVFLEENQNKISKIISVTQSTMSVIPGHNTKLCLTLIYEK